MTPQELITKLRAELETEPRPNIDILLSREVVRQIILNLQKKTARQRVSTEELNGYQLADAIDKRIANDIGLAEGWTGRGIDQLRECFKYVRTVGTSCDLLQQELEEVLLQRYRDSGWPKEV